MTPALEAFLLARIKFGAADECWLWTGSLSQGYGRLVINGTSRRAHRVVFEWKRGPIPDGLQLDHLCRNRACVNPQHLEIVDGRTNTLRGISPTAVNAKQTHCVKGHPLSGDNLMLDHRGHRRCRECQRWHEKQSKTAARAAGRYIDPRRNHAKRTALAAIPEGEKK